MKKGEFVTASIMGACYDPVYFKNPHDFNIDRWLNDETKMLDPTLFVPFSAGPRNCIGVITS